MAPPLDSPSPPLQAGGYQPLPSSAAADDSDGDDGGARGDAGEAAAYRTLLQEDTELGSELQQAMAAAYQDMDDVSVCVCICVAMQAAVWL